MAAGSTGSLTPRQRPRVNVGKTVGRANDVASPALSGSMTPRMYGAKSPRPPGSHKSGSMTPRSTGLATPRQNRHNAMIHHETGPAAEHLRYHEGNGVGGIIPPKSPTKVLGDLQQYTRSSRSSSPISSVGSELDHELTKRLQKTLTTAAHGTSGKGSHSGRSSRGSGRTQTTAVSSSSAHSSGIGQVDLKELKGKVQLTYEKLLENFRSIDRNMEGAVTSAQLEKALTDAGIEASPEVISKISSSYEDPIAGAAKSEVGKGDSSSNAQATANMIDYSDMYMKMRKVEKKAPLIYQRNQRVDVPEGAKPLDEALLELDRCIRDRAARELRDAVREEQIFVKRQALQKKRQGDVKRDQFKWKIRKWQGGMDLEEAQNAWQKHYGEQQKKRDKLLEALLPKDRSEEELIESLRHKIYSKSKSITHLFRKMDADGSGTVSIGEFKEGLKTLNIVMTPAEENFIVRKVDVDGSGEIDYQEFAVALQDKVDMSDKKKDDDYVKVMRRGVPVMVKYRDVKGKEDIEKFLPDNPKDYKLLNKRRQIVDRMYGSATTFKDIFRKFDTDKSGKLSYDEMREGLNSIGIDVDQDEVQKLCSNVDKDKSGEVDFEEFCNFFQPESFRTTTQANRALGLATRTENKWDPSLARYEWVQQPIITHPPGSRSMNKTRVSETSPDWFQIEEVQFRRFDKASKVTGARTRTVTLEEGDVIREQELPDWMKISKDVGAVEKRQTSMQEKNRDRFRLVRGEKIWSKVSEAGPDFMLSPQRFAEKRSGTRRDPMAQEYPFGFYTRQDMEEDYKRQTDTGHGPLRWGIQARMGQADPTPEQVAQNNRIPGTIQLDGQNFYCVQKNPPLQPKRYANDMPIIH